MGAFQRLRANEEPLCPDDIKNEKLSTFICTYCKNEMILESKFIKENEICPVCKKGTLKNKESSDGLQHPLWG